MDLGGGFLEVRELVVHVAAGHCRATHTLPTGLSVWGFMGLLLGPNLAMAHLSVTASAWAITRICAFEFFNASP